MSMSYARACRLVRVAQHHKKDASEALSAVLASSYTEDTLTVACNIFLHADSLLAKATALYYAALRAELAACESEVSHEQRN